MLASREVSVQALFMVDRIVRELMNDDCVL